MSGSGGTAWAGDPAAVATALRSLRERYRVVTQRPVDGERVWLDTADWRLYRAGLSLVSTAAPDGTVLELTGPQPAADDGPGTVRDVPAGTWPRLLAGLPAELQGPLAPVLDVRALLPVARVRVRVGVVALLDAEDKTVVRLEHERPGRLRVLPVRGYPKDAERAARAARAAGLVPDDRSGYRAALEAAGQDPGAARSPAVRADLPAQVAVARVLLGFLDDLADARQGTVDDIDTEFLHDLRVAVRRSRSAVKLLGDVLPPRLAAWAGPQLKWLGDLTTPVRDLDVHLLGLPDATARLRAGHPTDLQPLADHLGGVRARERRVLVRGLRSARFERFRTRWRADLETLAAEPAEPREGPTALDLGLARLDRAHRRVLRPGARITPGSPAEALHELRKRAKELRYLLEIFGPLLDGGSARRGIKELKGLQDVLGRFQDSEVQRDALTSMAQAMLEGGTATAPALLAMGEIAADLADRQVRARAEFSRRFERFATAGRWR